MSWEGWGEGKRKVPRSLSIFRLLLFPLGFLAGAAL